MPEDNPRAATHPKTHARGRRGPNGGKELESVCRKDSGARPGFAGPAIEIRILLCRHVLRNEAKLKLALLILFALSGFSAFDGCRQVRREPVSKASRPIPKTWDDESLATFELPLADPSVKVAHVSTQDYYRITERSIYRSYPIYAPGKEPPGYMEWLKQQEPELLFDPSRYQTDEDWIKAGEIVFDAPITRDEHSFVSDVREPAWYEKNKVPVA